LGSCGHFDFRKAQHQFTVSCDTRGTLWVTGRDHRKYGKKIKTKNRLVHIKLKVLNYLVPQQKKKIWQILGSYVLSTYILVGYTNSTLNTTVAKFKIFNFKGLFWWAIYKLPKIKISLLMKKLQCG
jgi:hypothetical protein